MEKVSLEWGVSARCFLYWVFLLSEKTHQDDSITVQQCALETDRPEKSSGYSTAASKCQGGLNV